MAKPFLKWAGGKSALLPQLIESVPYGIQTYREPFLGGGALFFALHERHQIEEAVLNDQNAELINVYAQVRDSLGWLALELGRLEREYLGAEDRATYYYEVRRTPSVSPLKRAARLIFLNRTCYNGLYRVNRQGEFNVPHGRYEAPRIRDPAGLDNASAALQRATLSNTDFADACAGATQDDFIYFDPPYEPVSATANFTGYTSSAFPWSEQERLRDLAVELSGRGCRVLLSNSSAPRVAELYSDTGFSIRTVETPRRINSKGTGRGFVEEVLLLNFDVRNIGQQPLALTARA